MINVKQQAGIVLFLVFWFSAGAGIGLAWSNPVFPRRDIVLAKNVSKQDMEALYNRMNLTEKQRLQLEENRKRHHARMKALTDQLSAAQLQLNKELEQSVLDKFKIDQLKAQIDRLQAELTDLRLKGILDVRAILTSDQYEIFSESMP